MKDLNHNDYNYEDDIKFENYEFTSIPYESFQRQRPPFFLSYAACFVPCQKNSRNRGKSGSGKEKRYFWGRYIRRAGRNPSISPTGTATSPVASSARVKTITISAALGKGQNSPGLVREISSIPR